MKKSKLFVSILLCAFATIGCSCSEEPVVENPIEKTKMKYTYLDYANHYYKPSSAIPNQGDPEILVLPVYFVNSATFIPEDKKSVVKADIEKSFFGTKEDCGFESVTSYYSTLSVGKCNLKGKVSDWIEVEDQYQVYAASEEATMRLVNEVVDKYFLTSNEDRTKYDLDNNGYLDGVVLIYAAPDYENISSEYYNFWAYTNWVPNKASVESPTACNFFWASYDFMYSKSVANTKLGNRYGSGDSSNSELIIDTHVFIHEMGHMFGLQDYYDYSGQFAPAGGFSMQDYNVASHDAFSTMALGWADPYIPTESCTITIGTFQKTRECILLSYSWNEIDSPFDEYMLLELYSPDGLNKFDHDHAYFANRPNKIRPKGPSEIGIRLWHVDARLLAYPASRAVSNITVDPTAEGDVTHAMSNTYAGRSGASYISPLGTAYANYNILQLIRNEETQTYQSKDMLDSFSLFKNGSKFSMNTFAKQFVNKGRLNSNNVLGWNFTVEIDGEQAKIALIRTI